MFLYAALEESAFVVGVGVAGVLVEEVMDDFVTPAVEASDFNGVRRDIFAAAAGFIIFTWKDRRHHDDGDLFVFSILGTGAFLHLIKGLLEELFGGGIDMNSRGSRFSRMAHAAPGHEEEHEKSQK
jgi:hypothetical protein